MLYIVAPYSMNVKTAMSELLAYIHHYICKENSPTPMISMTNKFKKIYNITCRGVLSGTVKSQGQGTLHWHV